MYLNKSLLELRLLYSIVEMDKLTEVKVVIGGNAQQCEEASYGQDGNSSNCNENRCSDLLFSEQVVSECEKLIAGENVSELTFRQYQSMDNNAKMCIHNRVRQWALRARNVLPNEHGLFCLVVAHLLKNAHHYFKLKSPSDFQTNILEQNSISENTKNRLVAEFKEANRKIRHIGSLKNKNWLKEQEELVCKLKNHYPSFRKIARASGISLKSVHNWCSQPKGKVRKMSALAQLRKDEFECFLLQDSISYAHPSKKYVGKRFLHDTLEVTRTKYLQQSEFHSHGIISMSSMKAYRPPYILLCGKTPLDQCLCDECENCEQLLKSLASLGVKEVPGNRYAAIDAIVCSECDQQFRTSIQFPKMKRLVGECRNCGMQKLNTVLQRANEQMLFENKNITWRRWTVQKGKSAPDKCQIHGTLKQAFGELMKSLKFLKCHLFRANWNRHLFEYSRKVLRPGEIVQIFDFAMNFRNIYQDEVQSAYWEGSQTGIHAVINYYPCPNGCEEMVTLILAQITDDFRHDSFVAHAGHEASFKYLAESGIPMQTIIQFCDNCASQYKSRRPFAEMAHSSLQIIRVFFGEKHGKSQCDGFFGCLKSWMSYKIKTRKVIVTNARDFFRYCKSKYETLEAEHGNCQHYKVVFQYLRPSDI